MHKKVCLTLTQSNATNVAKYEMQLDETIPRCHIASLLACQLDNNKLPRTFQFAYPNIKCLQLAAEVPVIVIAIIIIIIITIIIATFIIVLHYFHTSR